MQCKEWDDANSELFKESHDEAVHKNSYKSRLYELISASLVNTGRREVRYLTASLSAVFPPTGIYRFSITYYSYRDPSPAAQYSGHMSSLFFEEIYCFFLKKCNLNTPPGKLIFLNIFRRSIFLFQRYHYFVIGIQLMFIQ